MFKQLGCGSLHNHNSVTVCARYKISMVSERREDELYGDIWWMTIAQSIYQVLLFEHRQKNQLNLDLTMCASHYRAKEKVPKILHPK